MSEALEDVFNFVKDIVVTESTRAVVFASPELDQLCLDLGRLSLPVSIGPPDPDRTVFLVTALYTTGGHTRVLTDLIKADPGCRTSVLVSGVDHDLALQDMRAVLARSGVGLELAPSGDFAEKVAWLQGRLAELCPSRTYNLQHHYDSVIAAAAQPELVGTLFYFHHCDHTLALGVHAPHAIHVDFNGKGFHHCRSVVGVKRNVFWPLVADIGSYLAADQLLSAGAMTTVTSGGSDKFDTSHLTEWSPYLYDYKFIVPMILRATRGTHVHIGSLKPDALMAIKAGLVVAGIETSRFVHVPQVDNVAAELVKRQADLYIGSFPFGGGRAIVEAMGAGVPMLLHDNYVSMFFSDVGEAYPGVMVWRHPEELDRILRGLTAEQLADHARRARAHYEASHQPELLKKAIAGTLAGAPLAEPTAPTHHPDPLQRVLDRKAAPAGPPVDEVAPIFVTDPEASDVGEEASTRIIQPATIAPLAVATLAAKDIRTKDLAKLIFLRSIKRQERTMESGASATAGAASDISTGFLNAILLFRLIYICKTTLKRVFTLPRRIWLMDRRQFSNWAHFRLFMSMCAAYSLRRLKNPAVANSEHGFAAAKFRNVCKTRYRQGFGLEVRLWRPHYLSQRAITFAPAQHFRLFLRAPFAYAKLYTANVLKIQGFFDDAEVLYRGLINKQSVRALALTGLGDLLLLQALWASQFFAYEEKGIARNPHLKLRYGACAQTWHKRRFPEAIDVLKSAVATDLALGDAHWLLTCAYLEAGASKEALAAVQRYKSFASAMPYHQFAEARALFGVDNIKGTEQFSAVFGASPYSVNDVEIVSVSELSDRSEIACHQSIPSTSLNISSKVVQKGEILDFTSQVSFPPMYIAQFEYAEILPMFDMVLANGKYLISDTLHHERCDWAAFTPAIKAMAGDRAMLFRNRAPVFQEPDCLFIGHNNNYYHWLVDELPRLLAVQESSGLTNLPILLDRSFHIWQRDLLIRLGTDPSAMRLVDFTDPIMFKRLVVPSHLSRNMVAHPRAIEFIRQRLAPHAEHAHPKSGKRVYLRRHSLGVRKSTLLNEQSVIEQFKKAGFEFVDPGAMTIDQQIDYFSDAEVIAGPGGAAMTNALFAPAGTKLLELSSSNMLCETFGSLASTLKQEHWWCAGTSYARSYPTWVWTTFDYEISYDDIKLCFENVL